LRIAAISSWPASPAYIHAGTGLRMLGVVSRGSNPLDKCDRVLFVPDRLMAENLRSELKQQLKGSKL
jgi:hypothetical protein